MISKRKLNYSCNWKYKYTVMFVMLVTVSHIEWKPVSAHAISVLYWWIQWITSQNKPCFTDWTPFRIHARSVV